ncbi:hypothetical protein CAL65_16280 [Alkalilimnicola ehrlichii]|uniref:CBS domain-containing protein n=2 Tax=Alkalilimnicola ehrlichii TaxID=351052 RepID=A0A3E0WM70_9GAMM|nr:hypothetical protein CAL65_16280 [Alkalilimnicola ehrlichii]
MGFLLKMLPQEKAAQVMSQLKPPYQTWLVEDLANYQTSALLEDMPADDRTALLGALDASSIDALIAPLPEPEQARARRLLAYPPRSIGRLADPDCLRLRPEWSVAKALQEVRRQAARLAMTNVVFVEDADGRFLGALRLKRLVLAEPASQVGSLLQGPPIFIRADADRERGVQMVRHYDLEALPIVDDEARLLGMATVDDLLDVAEQASTEDFQKLGGVGLLGLRLRDAGIGLLYRKRIGWLLLLIVVGAIGSSVIAQFEASLQAMLVLVTFLPLVVDSGGNAGAQAATLAVLPWRREMCGPATGAMCWGGRSGWLRLWA